MEEIKQDLSDIPFAELQKIQERVGSKVYNEALFGAKRQSSQAAQKQFKRANKNRPQEVSSKIQVSRFREVVPVQKPMARDPRFDDLSGKFREELFDKNYKFIEDIREKEKQELEKALKKTKDSQKQQKIQKLLTKLEQEEKAKNKKQKAKDIEKKLVKKEKELVKEGKKPFFLKKSDKRKLELAEKFRALKSSGKMERYLAKRRKKNAQKARRKLPSATQVDS